MTGLELLLLGAVAVFLLGSSDAPALTSTSQDVPARASGTAPLPYGAPAGSPNGVPSGANRTTLDAFAPYADRVSAGIFNVIDAARATDDKSGSDGSDNRQPPAGPAGGGLPQSWAYPAVGLNWMGTPRGYAK